MEERSGKNMQLEQAVTKKNSTEEVRARIQRRKRQAKENGEQVVPVWLLARRGIWHIERTFVETIERQTDVI